jgi:hypothetical protein
MKLNKNSIESKSNFKEKKRIIASIDNPVKMLRMFTKDLYKHPLQTSIQEYINNAKDAHIMAKKDCSAIEITAPTMANQNVIIKDFGLGLSPADIENVFARITASNKDTSDKFNGGFGIGSKSWFAINPSFYVVSTFNGTKTSYEISFTDNIYIDVQDEEETSEKNSVTVILPLANSNQIEDSVKSIKRAIKFWKVRPKLINFELGELPCVYDCKDFKIIAYTGKPSISVTLGETQYSINDFEKLRHIRYRCASYSIQIKFEVGEVKLKNSQEVGPDRENFALTMEEHVISKFNKIIMKMPSILKKIIKEEKNIERISKIVNLDEYPHESYSTTIDGLPMLFMRRNLLPLDRKLKDSWLPHGRKSKAGFIEIDPRTLLIKMPNIHDLKKHKRTISQQILDKEKKYNRVCFIEYSDGIDSVKEVAYKKFFTIKNYSEYNIKIPKSLSEKLKENNPSVNILERGIIPTSSNRIKKYSANKKFKVDMLDKKIPIIESNNWRARSSSYGSFRYSINVLQLQYYVVSTDTMKILLKRGFKELTVANVNLERKKFDRKQKTLMIKENKEKLTRLNTEAERTSTKNKLKWFNLVEYIYKQDSSKMHDVFLNIFQKYFSDDKIISNIPSNKILPYRNLIDLKRKYLCLWRKSSFEKMFPQETEGLERIKSLIENNPLLMLAIYKNDSSLEDEIHKLILMLSDD